MYRKTLLVLIASAMVVFAGCGEDNATEIITETEIGSTELSSDEETMETDETTVSVPDADEEITEADVSVTETEAEDAPTETAVQTTAQTAADTTTVTTAEEIITEAEEDEAEEVVSEVDDEELVDDAESGSSALSGKWTVTKISDSSGNESSLKEFCELIEVKQDELKAVYSISDDGIISVALNGKTKEYSYFEADGNIIMSDDDSMTILMYDPAKKTLTFFDDTYGVNLILTK